MKNKILIITQATFHDNIQHAGGQTINHYFKKYIADKSFDVSLMCVGEYNKDFEKMAVQFEETKIFFDKWQKSFFKRTYDFITINYLFKWLSKISPFYFATNPLFKQRIKLLLNKASIEKYIPDIIIVEHTSMIFMGKYIQQEFPKAKLVASCHDIIFQSKDRLLGENKNYLNKLFITGLKNAEKKQLERFDLILVPSEKDKLLIEQELKIEVSKILAICHYFQKYNLLDVEFSKKEGFVFFGYMRRRENVESVMWFLENVWKEFQILFPLLKFFIVGGGISEEDSNKILKYKNVVVTGYVKDPTIFFSKSYAMIVPLKFGAGIKIKSLEALVSGMLLISTDIGVEGIGICDEVHFLKANSGIEFIEKMELATKNREVANQIIANSKNYVAEFFSLEKSYISLKDRIYNSELISD